MSRLKVRAPDIDQSNKLSDVFDQDIEWFRLISPDLAIAVAVLEEQHVRRAAERLGVPQPTVSVVMRRLADAIGAPLVQPRGRGIVATEAGRAFLPAAQAALVQHAQPDKTCRRSSIPTAAASPSASGTAAAPATYPGCSTHSSPHTPISPSPSSRAGCPRCSTR